MWARLCTKSHFSFYPRCLPRQPGAGISLESYVYNILYEVMLPQPGKSIRVYLPPTEPHLPAIAVILQRPLLATELPLLDFPLRLLFKYLGVECVIQLLTCVLLENQVLLRSTGRPVSYSIARGLTHKAKQMLKYLPVSLADYQRLMIVGECITSLLFPFVWPHVYAPILPAALHHFLDAPVPFVMGLHAECEAAHKIGSEATLCFVDIDKKHIQLPEELPVFPHKMDFMAEIGSVLDKFEIDRDRDHEPSFRNGYVGRGAGGGVGGSGSGGAGGVDAMISSCTLPTGLQAVRRSKERFQQLQETVYTLSGSPGGGVVDYQPLIAHPSRIDHVPRIADFLRRKGGIRGAGSPVGSPTVSLSSSPVGIYHDVDAVDATMPASARRTEKQKLTPVEQYYQDLRINNSVREIFLNRFVHMFHAYEYFVIYPNQARDEWISNRETLQNFDKSSFLSDQPEHHRAFLSRFLESQMFATLIDNKILAMWESQPDEQLQLFDQRVKLLR